jgi:hypothetical protein
MHDWMRWWIGRETRGEDQELGRGEQVVQRA